MIIDMEDYTQHGWELPGTSDSQDFTSTPSVARTDKDLIVKNFYNFTNTEAQLLRGQKVFRTSVGTTYSTALVDYIIGVTSLVNAPTIGLPRPILAGKGKLYVVKDEVGGAGTTTITVVSQGEETIDGAANKTLTSNYQAVSFYTDGQSWFTY